MNKKNIFLLDGYGALLSVFLHIIILPYFSFLIGLPKKLHYILAVFPLIYMCNSFLIYLKADHSQPRWLRIVVIGNILYGLVTGILLNVHWQDLTVYGVTYFVFEYLVLLIIIHLEINVLRNIKTVM